MTASLARVSSRVSRSWMNHEVGDLLDDGQRVGQPVGPEGLPERVDLVFQFAGDHSWPRFSQFVEFKKL